MKLFARIIHLSLFLPLLWAGNLQAQYYLTGQDPASIHWQQIKTADIQLVFPKGYDRVAEYYMNILKITDPYVRQPYLKKQQRLTIILHNESTTSNATVSPAPFRADFFDMPDQQTYPQIWQKQLALHEYRHAVQMGKMRQGFGNVLYYLLGEQGTAALFGTFLPFWFIEGDAVYSETIHSRSGRGRIPDFVYPLQAQVLEHGIYPYDKALFGSYRNFVPDHYSLGYQLVLKGIEQHGIGMWNDILNRVARESYTLIPFTHGLKKNTGHGKVNFYRTSIQAIQSSWKQDLSRQETDTFNKFSTNQRFYTNYLFPQPLSSGQIITEKSGIDDINRFVLLDEKGKETRLFTPGFDFMASLSANDSLICWNEKSFDPRWSNRDYSIIKIYNFKTKKLYQISHKSRYFAPALSPDASKVVVVKVDNSQHYSLDFLSRQDGRLLHSFKTPDNFFFMQPSWSNDGKQLIVSVLGNKGKSLLLLNTHNFSFRMLLPFSFREISHPTLFGNWVVYTGTYDGKDNLYAVNIHTSKVFSLFNAQYGAKDARFSRDGHKLYFSNYTANGFKPAYISFYPNQLKTFDISKHQFKYPIDKIHSPKTFVLDDTVIPHHLYPIKKYSRLGHLFNPYSWGPFAIDANSYSFTPGLSLLSQNKLSTAVTTASYLWDMNERTGKFKLTFDYLGWYPVISAGLTYGHRRIFSHDNNGAPIELHWKETNLDLEIRLPLSFTHSKWIRGFQPSLAYSQKFLQTFPGSAYKFKVDQVTAFTYQLFTYNQYKGSSKDIFPQWGQGLHLAFRHTPFSASPSSQFALQSWWYFPGIMRHQGLRIYYGYQWMNEGDYEFSEIVSIPRGYMNLRYNKMNSLKFDYAIPLVYPDLNWQGVAYLKRLYAKLFYDYLKTGGGSTFQSTGIELYSNWNFLSLFPDVSLGVRWSYTQEKNHIFEFLYGIQF